MSIFAKWEEKYLADNIELSDIQMAWLYSDTILTQIGISDIKRPSLESWVTSKLPKLGYLASDGRNPNI